MYPLIQILNADLINNIYHYNNYSKLDLEWFKFEHEERYRDVMIDLDHFFLRPRLRKVWIEYMVESIIKNFDDI